MYMYLGENKIDVDDNLKLHDVTFRFHICFSLFRSVCRFLAGPCWNPPEWPRCLVSLFEMNQTLLTEQSIGIIKYKQSLISKFLLHLQFLKLQ